MGRRYYTVRSGMLAPPFRETRCMADPYRPLRVPLHDTVITRGLRQHVTRWPGEDPEPLILLHGWMDTGDTFQFLVDAMPARRTFVAPDWRGFGRSEWPADGYWFPDYYGDLDALLDRLCAGRARHADRSQHGRQYRDLVSPASGPSACAAPSASRDSGSRARIPSRRRVATANGCDSCASRRSSRASRPLRPSPTFSSAAIRA